MCFTVNCSYSTLVHESVFDRMHRSEPTKAQHTESHGSANGTPLLISLPLPGSGAKRVNNTIVVNVTRDEQHGYPDPPAIMHQIKLMSCPEQKCTCEPILSL